MLSDVIRRELEAALGASIERVAPVGGGCISTTLELQLVDGRRCFVKLAGDEPPGAALLVAEAESLAALRAARAVRVPQPVASGRGWLALEWLEPGSARAGTWERLGTALARLHRTRGPAFGWPADGFIGSLPQANGLLEDWPRFWWERRLLPQLERTIAPRLLSRSEADPFRELEPRLPALLEPAAADGPALLHGDLWHGNVHVTSGGEAALVDPASYYGHREVDLAMAALFGGFPAGFWSAYEQAWPLQGPGLEQRRACYQLFYLLVHVNLFGRGYLAGSLAAHRRALA